LGVPQAVRDRYSRDESALIALSSYVRTTLAPFCQDRDYPLSHRIKSLESTAEKLESGRYRTWSELDDLVGLTVVVPTQSHVKGVADFLDSTFDRKIIRDSSTAATSPDTFRFNATRWYGRLRESDPPPPVEERAQQLTFEVQVHTAFEHAWIVVTHDLVYKGEEVGWRDRRLAAQMKAIVEQLDTMVEHFELVAGGLQVSGYPEVDAMSEAIANIKSLIDSGTVDNSMQPESWTRFGENLLGLVRQAGDRRTSADRLRSLTDSFVAAVTSGELVPAMSASLYQAVVSHATASGLNLSSAPLVASGLDELYGISPTVPIDLDA